MIGESGAHLVGEELPGDEKDEQHAYGEHEHGAGEHGEHGDACGNAHDAAEREPDHFFPENVAAVDDGKSEGGDAAGDAGDENGLFGAGDEGNEGHGDHGRADGRNAVNESSEQPGEGKPDHMGQNHDNLLKNGDFS